ncbi:MAG: hypothetical protein OXR64_11355 [Chloroflexota bacterium]|nr:hypothetical protein [Chloroflexota bacterium]MDE2920422.1 hypothetical protein [Chloroflexota bacterium]
MIRNPNDGIRERMLQYFYDRNANSTSERGRRGSQVRISDVKRELKELHGLTQPQVMANLTYLIDSGWVERLEERRTFKTPRGTSQPSTSTWYKITNTGIDLIEGQSSAFKRADPFEGISVTAFGSNVQIGDGNYANNRYNGLSSELETLREELVDSNRLNDIEKLAAAADIETVQMQIAKPEPNLAIIREALSPIKKLARAAGFLERVTNIAAQLGIL